MGRGRRKPKDSRSPRSWGSALPPTRTLTLHPHPGAGTPGGSEGAGFSCWRCTEGGDTLGLSTALRHVAAPPPPPPRVATGLGGRQALAHSPARLPPPPPTVRGLSTAPFSCFRACVTQGKRPLGLEGRERAGPWPFKGGHWGPLPSPPPRPGCLSPHWRSDPAGVTSSRTGGPRARASIHSLRLSEPSGGPETRTESMNGERLGKQRLLPLPASPPPPPPPSRLREPDTK